MIIKTLAYLRKEDTSKLLALSAIAMLLLAGPLVISNFLFQPVQAQTAMTFKTLKPAISSDGSLLLTFDAQGNTSTSDPSSVDITNGTIQWQVYPNGGIVTAEINSGDFNNNRGGGEITLYTLLDGIQYTIQSDCGTSEYNPIIESKTLGTGGLSQQRFTGPVECSPSSHEGGDTASSSMTGTTTTTQDSDGDGIPDSSDRCPNNSHHRCFKEGEASTTSTSTSPNQQQEQPSSSIAGNQTR